MTSSYLESAVKQFKHYHNLGTKTIIQLEDKDLSFEPVAGINSMIVIVKHMHGNMLSRWTDFLTTDGEKPWRTRDEEFEGELLTKIELLTLWEEGWACLYAALNSLNEIDFQKTVQIRGEALTVTDAINRQLCHYSYHVGQMVYLAKIIKGDSWENLSIPKAKK